MMHRRPGAAVAIGSRGFVSPRRRVRLLAILAVRDQVDYLRGFLANVAPQVDGIVALDDGSTDGSVELLAAHGSVLEVLRNPVDRAEWDEMGNHRRLVAAGLAHGADYLIALDADERLERRFRARAERVIRRGAKLGHCAYAVRLREVWGSPWRYRCDGVWDEKVPPRLFRALADHEFDTRKLHGFKAPLQCADEGRFPVAGLNVYHLAMLTCDLRTARRARYERLDPNAEWQELGYAYLTDERGLRLRRVRAGRRYVE